jgi:hypothetical protein
MKRPALTYVLCEGAVKNGMGLSVTSCTNKQQPLMLPCRWLQTCTTSLLLLLLLLLSQLYWLSEPCLLLYLEEHRPLPGAWCKRCRVDGTLEQSKRVVPNGWVNQGRAGKQHSTAAAAAAVEKDLSRRRNVLCLHETRSKQAVAD